MKYRQFADYVKQRQRMRLKAMRRPDEEWWPEIYLDGAASGSVYRQDIPVRWFNDADSKAALFHDVIAPVVALGAYSKVALVVTMYLLTSDHPMGRVITQRMEDDPDASPTEGLPRFQDVEGSVENLVVHVFDAERHEAWLAEITRPKSGPPHLAPFDLPYGADTGMGDIIDPIKAALR